MRHNILLDSSLAGSPFHSLRAFIWNVKTLGFWWWCRCFVVNAAKSAVELAMRAEPVPIAAQPDDERYTEAAIVRNHGLRQGRY